MKKTLSVLIAFSMFQSLICTNLLHASFYVQSPVISPSLGIISDSNINNNKELIIFIQDLHSNPGVQKNISSIINTFNKNYGVKQILIEGAPYEKLNTDVMDSLKHYDTEKISNILLNKGLMTGTEYFIAANGIRNIPIYGLEDWEIYLSNIKRAAKIRVNSEYINDLYTDFAKLIHQKIKNSENLLKYINFDLSDTALLKQINQPILKYNTLYKYIFLSEKTSNFNTDIISEEHIQFVKELQKLIPYQQYKEITDKSQNNNLSDYWLSLYKEIINIPENKEKYNNFYTFLKYIIEKDKLNTVSLISQQNNYFNDYLQSLYVTDKDTEENLFILKMTQLFKSFLNLSISEDEYTFFINHYNRYINLIDLNLAENEYSRYKSLFKDKEIFDYHKINKGRNEIFIRNIVSSLKNKNNKNNITIVVAGGFHSSILNKLKKQNIQYLTITPFVKELSSNDGYNKIISSTLNESFSSQALSPIPMMLANNPLVPEQTREMFLEEFIEALLEVYSESPYTIKEKITEFSREEWAEPVSIHIKGDTFNIFIGNEKLSFNIIDGKVDFSKAKKGLIEDETVFIRDDETKETLPYEITVNGKSFVFDIEKKLADNITEQDLKLIADEILQRTTNNISVSIKQGDNQNAVRRIKLRTFTDSNSDDLFINNIGETNTFFINKSVLKFSSPAKKIFIQLAIIHSLAFIFHSKSDAIKTKFKEDDMRFILTHIDKDLTGLPDITKISEMIETEFGYREIKIVSQLKRFDGNLEELIKTVTKKDYLGEYRTGQWKHIVRDFLQFVPTSSAKEEKKLRNTQKTFFSGLVVDNSDKEPLQIFLDKRVSKDRQNDVQKRINNLLKHLEDNLSDEDKADTDNITQSLKDNIAECMEFMYRKIPRHIFEKYFNEKGMVSDHNLNHSLTLLKYVIDIVSKENASFKKFDIKVLVYSAFLHDISCMMFRQNHVNNSAIWAKAMLKESLLPLRIQHKIIASCLAHEKIGNNGERTEHKLSEARLIHDADGLSAVMDLNRIINVWLTMKEPFFVQERTIDERIELIRNDIFSHLQGGDAINDLMRHFMRMNPKRYLTKGAQDIVSEASAKKQDLVLGIINLHKEEIFKTYDITEEDYEKAISVIKMVFADTRYQKITYTPKEKEKHDDIFDHKTDIGLDNTLIIDIVENQDELYKIEKAGVQGLETLAVSFSDTLLNGIPLTLKTKLETFEVFVDNKTVQVKVFLNILKLASDHMDIITVEYDKKDIISEEILKIMIIKHLAEQISTESKRYTTYINPMENISIINFPSGYDVYEKLTDKKKLTTAFIQVFLNSWYNLPILYDVRNERNFIKESQKNLEINNIRSILAAS